MRGNEIKQEKTKINLKRKMHGYILVCERSGCLNGFETTINTFLRLIKIQIFFFPTEDSVRAEMFFFNSCRFLLISDISKLKNKRTNKKIQLINEYLHIY